MLNSPTKKRPIEEITNNEAAPSLSPNKKRKQDFPKKSFQSFKMKKSNLNRQTQGSTGPSSNKQQSADLLLLASNTENQVANKGLNAHSSITGSTQLNAASQLMTQAAKEGTMAFDPLQDLENSRIQKVIQ
jgi:hypothetical protein